MTSRASSGWRASSASAPPRRLARSDDELREAIGRFPRYFARAAFSRGGVSLLTNTGPLAGHVSPEDCRPTPQAPWLVQEFVDGPMVCTYSTVHRGRVTAHCTYRAPRQWEHSTGISFLSIDGEPSLRIVERIAGSLDYTGQMSLDFVDGADGLSIIECNPRTTDGALLMSPEHLSEGVLDPGRETRLVERDMLPTLYSFLAFAHHERMSRREHEQLFVAMADDLCWNGGPIAGMSADDAALVAELEGERAA